jgi:hypothetical protein
MLSLHCPIPTLCVYIYMCVCVYVDAWIFCRCACLKFFVVSFTSIIHAMGELFEFVGKNGITRFSNFVASTEEGVHVVIGCYLGVVEGVDMWFPQDASEGSPRFVIDIICVSGQMMFFTCIQSMRCHCY